MTTCNETDEEPFQMQRDTCSRERQRVKRIGDINERARLLTFRRLREQGESQARQPG